MKQSRPNGYTLIELMIVLAIIGMALILLVPAADRTNKVDQLANETREFADSIRQAQTQSYSVNTGQNGGAGCPAVSNGHGGFSVYWRGDVLEVDGAGQSVNMFLLCGNDLSAFAGNNNETVGITGKQPYSTISLNGLKITDIVYNGASICGSCQVSLAFLAPEGHNYDIKGFATPSSSSDTPYTDQAKVQIKVQDGAIPTLTGIVTIDATTGKIDSTVQ